MATDDALDLDGLTLRGERLVGIELTGAEVTDAAIEDCDLAGVTLLSPKVRRAVVTRTRLRDCLWRGGVLQDVSFLDCPTDGFSLRFCTLQRVTFSGCGLAGADFYAATFDHVVFERCDLRRAAFDSATVKELTLRSCELAGMTGALALRGATLDFDDLPALAPSLAREAGIRIAVGDE